MLAVRSLGWSDRRDWNSRLSPLLSDPNQQIGIGRHRGKVPYTYSRKSSIARIPLTRCHQSPNLMNAKEINRLTQKRRKCVVLPIQQELLLALETELELGQPSRIDRVLRNPSTVRILRGGLHTNRLF